MALRDVLDLLMFATMCAAIMAGFPVAFTLAGTALAFAAIGVAFGVFDLSFLGAFPNRIFGTMTNDVLISVPLFVFMGVMLERSRVAEDLLESMGRLFGHLRGGLGISVMIVGALLAASTGIVGATVVTMGLLSLPTMLRNGYDKPLTAGSIAASGTLGQIIPPSIVLVLLGDVMASSYQQAQLKQGNFAPDTVTVGDLFAGALFPGLMLVGLYIAYLIAMAILRPSSSPPIPPHERHEPFGAALMRSLRALVAPVVLIVAVLGSILSGIATPTEAAAIGAVGATFLAGFRASERTFDPPMIAGVAALLALLVLANAMDLRLGRAGATAAEQAGIAVALALCAIAAWALAVALRRAWTGGVLSPVLDQTTQITAMVFLILIGAALFSLVFRGLGGDDTIHELLNAIPGGPTGALIAVMAVMFVMGFFLDFIEIIFVVVVIVAPALLAMGFDPVWLGVMLAMNLQTSFLTPPFGFALFYLRGVAPPEVTTAHIYRGVVPFILLQVLALLLLWLFPGLATWLPSVIGS